MFSWRYILLVITLISCNSKSEKNQKDDIGLDFDHQIGLPEIMVTSKGRAQVKASSLKLLKDNSKDAILVGNVIADFFNEMGDRASRLYSDSAWINESADRMLARGNVTVESDNGYVLLSNSIVWDDRYGVISSKDSVVFFSAEGDTMYGVGFESDSDLDRWSIFKPHGVAYKK
jgi:hypothetical protein